MLMVETTSTSSTSDIGPLRVHLGPQSEPARAGAAVHVEDGAGDVRGVLGGEEQYRSCDVARVAGHSEGNCVHERRAQIVRCAIGKGFAPAAHVDVAGGD